MRQHLVQHLDQCCRKCSMHIRYISLLFPFLAPNLYRFVFVHVCTYICTYNCMYLYTYQFSSVAQSCLTLCNPKNHSTPRLPVHRQLPVFTQTHVQPVGDAIQPSPPLSSPCPPAFNLSQHQGLFQWVSSSHQVAKVLEFHFSISPSNEHPGLISFRMDWLDLLAVQGNLKSLLQHHSSKTSIFRAQLSL